MILALAWLLASPILGLLGAQFIHAGDLVDGTGESVSHHVGAMQHD